MFRNLPDWIKGKRPKASELQQMTEAIRYLLKFDVDGAYGLQFEWSGAGPKLSLIPRPLFKYGVVTGSTIPAFGSTAAGGANKYGMGTIVMDVETYSTSGVCTRSASTPARTLTVYNGGAETIPVGRRIGVYEKVPGRWHTIIDFCPA